MPIKTWQVWNEANFFYFAYPVSPIDYAKLLKLSTPVIKAAEPGAKVILTGLFGRPTAGAKRGMPAAEFLEGLYKVPGIKSYFDGVALHPYAIDSEELEEIVEELHEVTVANHDRVPLYITEMGWGSQNDFHIDAFEHGVRGQVEELKSAYTYLLANRDPAGPQTGLLVLLEGPARIVRLLRLGRPLQATRRRLPGEARLARLRPDHPRSDPPLGPPVSAAACAGRSPSLSEVAAT